jgi:hypothetical protein
VRTRALAIVLVLGLLGAASLGALDWDYGGSVDNSSTPSVTTASQWAMDQRNKAALWLDMRFSPAFSLAAEGSYSFSLLVPYIFDIDYLKADWQMLPALKLTAGRFVFSDFTGHVLNHKLDGVMLTWAASTGMITASVGTSAGLLKPSSLILMTNSDAGDQYDSGVYFAAPRLIEKLEGVVPNFLPRQDFTMTAILQQDLRAANTFIQPGTTQSQVAGASGGGLSSEYWGIGVSGAIVSNLYYSSFFYLNTGSTLGYVVDPASITGSSWEYASIFAFLGGIGLKYFNEDLLSMRAELQAVVSSGDADNTSYLEGNGAGLSNIFVPISQDTLGIAFQPQWGNLVLIDANYSLKPFAKSPTVWQNLQLMLKVLNFLRPTPGAISQLAGLNLSSSDPFLGTEFDLVANFRPFSDLGAALSFGAFIPNGDAFSGPAAQAVFAVRLEFSVSF